MIRSRKHKLLIALILVCTCGLTLGAEPNEAETELKIEIRNDRPSQMLLMVNLQPPFESTHYAVLFIRGDLGIYRRNVPIEAMLETSAGRAMSQKQRDLISNQSIQRSNFGKPIPNYTYFQLYGVSEDDTKKMVEAFIEILTNTIDARMRSSLNQQQELQEEIAKIKKELPEKQKQFKAAESKYKEIKDARYFSFDEALAYKKARETVLQMAKMLDVLEIELVGIEVKLKAIEEYRSIHHLSDNTVDKLEQIYVEQMIEQKSVKARKEATLRICNREKEFLDLSSLHGSLRMEVHDLELNLYESEKDLSRLEERLANPTPDMLPPKVFQNKVTIHPVRVN